ncbi:MAG: lipopolysaccharide biosynthesis protein [Clostridia bacterium]|nr:lipopolysaccharide biosynthesis protein [Clostridia bacterium]
MGNEKVTKAFGWKLFERFGVQGIQFVLQIILARLLSPELYGTLSIMIIFTTLANVFVQSGFNTALIQKKDVDERDYSSVFWVSLLVAGILYVAIYFGSPLIARYYEMPEIVAPFRVLALMLFPGAFNSVQLAKVTKELNFKKIFISNTLGMASAGITGIVIALNGGGLWALVAQSTLTIAITCVVMLFTVRWRPRLVCDLKRVGILFSFGWKILLSSLIDTLYQDLRSLVIGKKYDKSTLGFYNRGKQFPQFIINAINGTVQSVMLPLLSQNQERKDRIKVTMRTSITVSSYIIFPMMAGLAAVSAPVISLILTDKWLPAVPYMMIYCFTLAFTPVHSCNLQAINAMGRSDIFLRLEIIKKTIGVTSLVIAVFCFDSPIAIAMTGVFTTFISCFVNSFPNKKLIGYSYLEQMKDILPSFLLSMAMFGGVYLLTYLSIPTIVTLLLQIVTGVAIYMLGSALFRLKGFIYLKDYVISIIKRRGKKRTTPTKIDEGAVKKPVTEDTEEKEEL